MTFLKEKFEATFIPVPECGCWIWEGCDDGLKGYGKIWNNGKLLNAHRVSWQLYIGPIPKGIDVCHSCDTPSCVNPKHLFLGTRKDNMQDCVAKGRYARNGKKGEDHNMVKLSTQDVINIRNDSRMIKTIAADYHIHRDMVWRIKARRNWTHV